QAFSSANSVFFRVSLPFDESSFPSDCARAVGGGAAASAVTWTRYSSPPPSATTATAATTAATTFSLHSNIAFNAPFAKAATLAGTTPAAGPAAKTLAALIVEDTTEGGTLADAALWDSTAATAPPDTTNPCRARPFANRTLPRASRAASVPSGQPSCRAAFLRVLPSRSQRTIATRYLSGRRASS